MQWFTEHINRLKIIYSLVENKITNLNASNLHQMIQHKFLPKINCCLCSWSQQADCYMFFCLMSSRQQARRVLMQGVEIVTTSIFFKTSICQNRNTSIGKLVDRWFKGCAACWNLAGKGSWVGRLWRIHLGDFQRQNKQNNDNILQTSPIHLIDSSIFNPVIYLCPLKSQGKWSYWRSVVYMVGAFASEATKAHSLGTKTK